MSHAVTRDVRNIPAHRRNNVSTLQCHVNLEPVYILILKHVHVHVHNASVRLALTLTNSTPNIISATWRTFYCFILFTRIRATAAIQVSSHQNHIACKSREIDQGVTHYPRDSHASTAKRTSRAIRNTNTKRTHCRFASRIAQDPRVEVATL